MTAQTWPDETVERACRGFYCDRWLRMSLGAREAARRWMAAALTAVVPRAELEAMRRDAERYLLIRAAVCNESSELFAILVASTDFISPTPELLDAAIDAAIAGSKPK